MKQRGNSSAAGRGPGRSTGGSTRSGRSVCGLCGSNAAAPHAAIRRLDGLTTAVLAVLAVGGAVADEAGSPLDRGDPALRPFAASAPTPPERVEREELLRRDEAPRWNAYLGVSVVSQYVSRGLVFLPEPSMQPWLEVDIPLCPGAPAGSSGSGLSVFGGFWNNLNLGNPQTIVQPDGSLAEVRDWYEADAYLGLRFGLGDQFAASLRYNLYTSPSGSFERIHELDLRLSYDDSALWSWNGPDGRELAVYPAVRITAELSDRGGPEGWYVQPSLTPTWQSGSSPLRLELPLVLGFGGGGQYVTAGGDERLFGFFQAGLHASADLDLIPEWPGSITVAAGVDVAILSDSDLGYENDPTEWVGSLSVIYSY